MKQIAATIDVPVTADTLWSFITDVRSYPEVMPFTYLVRTKDNPVQINSTWTDITTLFWIPLPMTHRVYRYNTHKEFAQHILLPFSAKVDEQFSLESVGKNTTLVVNVQFDPGSLPFAKVLENLWEKRMGYLVYTALHNFQRHFTK